MSAYLVSTAHIDVLVAACQLGGTANDNARTDDELVATTLGRLLWLENMRSVAYRYPHKPNCAVDVELLKFYRAKLPSRAYTPVELLAALDGFEHQANEHPDWMSSRAQQFCAILREDLSKRVPDREAAKDSREYSDCWAIG